MNWPKSFPVLGTERLLLRQVAEEDSEGVFRCYSCPALMEFVGEPLTEPDSVEGLVSEYAAGIKDGSSIIWALEERGSGSFAGTAGFEEFSFLDFRGTLGFTLLGEFQGRGLMTEALRRIVDYGFEELGLERIEALVAAENHRSVKLLTAMGFTLEGVHRKRVFFAGRFHDHATLAVVREDRTS